VPILVKIDQEMRLTVRTDGYTDRQTERQMQTDFITCPMLYAIATGQINNKIQKQHYKTGCTTSCWRWLTRLCRRCCRIWWLSSHHNRCRLFLSCTGAIDYYVGYVSPAFVDQPKFHKIEILTSSLASYICLFVTLSHVKRPLVIIFHLTKHGHPGGLLEYPDTARKSILVASALQFILASDKLQCHSIKHKKDLCT